MPTVYVELVQDDMGIYWGAYIYDDPLFHNQPIEEFMWWEDEKSMRDAINNHYRPRGYEVVFDTIPNGLMR